MQTLSNAAAFLRRPHKTRPIDQIYRSTLVVLIVGFLLFSANAWREARDEARQELSSTTHQFAQMVGAEFGHQQAMLRLLGSRLLAIGALDDPERGRPLIEEMFHLNPALAGFGLARPDGQLVLVSGVPAGKALPNLLQQEDSRDGFQAALKRHGIVVGRSYYFPLLKRWLIPVRLALHEHGKVVGVMIVGINIDSPDALWNVVRLATGQSVTLVRDDAYVQLRRSMPAIEHEALYSRPVDWHPAHPADPLIPDSIAETAYLPKLGLSIVSAYTGRQVMDGFIARMTDPLWIFTGALLVSLVLYRFVSRSQQRYEDSLIYHATHDTLTGMPNRALIADRIDVEIAHARRHSTKLGVIYLDLDNFKQINDNYGHQHGDRLLQAVAERIRKLLRDEDTLGRMGGDEFVILIPGLGMTRDAEILGERIRGAFGRPFELFDREYFVNASIGIAIYPDDGEDSALLLSRADAALYRAKAQGRDCICFFEERFNREIERRVVLEQGLRQALSRGELRVLYQPKVDSDTAAWVGAEALVRWHSQELGDISPEEFIPVAEESGLIQDLGHFVLQTALRDLNRIHEVAPDFQMAVNVSVRQFRDKGFISDLMRCIQDTDTDPSLLELEVTESIVAEPQDEIGMLRDVGVWLAIDDFGTGFSSLSSLKRLPVTTLKIDRAFIRDLEIDPADKALVTATIAVARELNLQTVAEGVETAGQAEYLRARGCTLLQGYYFSRPIELDELIAALARH